MSSRGGAGELEAWISVEDALPAMELEVLAYVPFWTAMNPLFACRRPAGQGQWQWTLADGGTLPYAVSHWTRCTWLPGSATALQE